MWITYHDAFLEWEQNVSGEKISARILQNRLRIADVFSMQFLGRERKRDRSPSGAEILHTSASW